jgi:putative ABC transport system ATP-binding protein
MPILEVNALKKIYTTRFGSVQVQALSNVSFSVEEGEYVAIMGEAGSGKPTLLNILAALDRPTAGEVLLDGRSIWKISERELSAFRRDNLGFVFQDCNLLDTFSHTGQHIPALGAGREGIRRDVRRLEPIAKKLGIQDILSKFPYEGLRRREAARGRSPRPHHANQAHIADEPTGALTPARPTRSLRLFNGINATARPSHGHPQRQGGQPRAARSVFADGEVYHQLYRGIRAWRRCSQRYPTH